MKLSVKNANINGSKNLIFSVKTQRGIFGCGLCYWGVKKSPLKFGLCQCPEEIRELIE